MSGRGAGSAQPLGPPARPATAGQRSLSPDLENAAARRLAALALVVALVAIVIATITELLDAPTALGPRLRLGIIALDVVLSVGLFAAIVTGRLSSSRALALGTPYQMAHGLLASVNFHAMTLLEGPVRGWTPVAVWAMLYPLVVPSRPGRVWLATLLTAAMDPLAVGLSLTAGAPSPSVSDLVQTLFPVVMVCFLAPVAARIVYGLTVEVKRAREMGSYRLVEKLGQGGMGEVWRAEHRLLARGAAVKLIRPAALGAGEGSRAHEMVKRFEREAQATAALRSPHTIEVYDYGVAADGTFHYVMELLEGFSLQTLVDRFGPIPPERAVGLLRQACHSLAEAHAAGLVHRDVKPANLFVCRLGLDVDFVKVLDFGLVKVQAPAPDEEALTGEGAFAGTPAYMPPEVALAQPIDARADIYALGCVAYWLLTGQRVFESGNPMQLIVDHVRTPPVPPSRRAGQPIPEALEAIVMQCLEKDPGARHGSVSGLSSELQALGIEALWTDARAREWWSSARVSVGEGEDLPSLPWDASSDATRSQPTARARPGRGTVPSTRPIGGPLWPPPW
jgi:eukaryotic-like serine/threonine-protein kinase